MPSSRVWKPRVISRASRSLFHSRDAGLGDVQALIAFFLSSIEVHDYVTWYYTPMALQFTTHLRPAAVVYDCMDELSAFGAAADSGISAMSEANSSAS
jgi:hypothetical protein